MFVHLFVLSIKLLISARILLVLTSQEVGPGVGGHTKPQKSKNISKESDGNVREFSRLRHV